MRHAALGGYTAAGEVIGVKMLWSILGSAL